MATQFYFIDIRSAGVRQTGLTPTWVMFKKGQDDSDLSQPAISEVGHGVYKFSYDPATPAVGQVDAGSGVPDPQDRYITTACL